MSEYATIRYAADDGVATLTLDRPDRLNGMTNRMVRETYEALSAAADDPSLRVLVLTGAGRGFCPGADLGHFTSDERNPADDEPLEVAHFHVARLLHEMPAVTVAAINGACAGAGLGWACGCDLRLATRSANFSTAFLRVAVAGDMGLPWSLPRLVGAARARELSFLCEKFGAEEARAWGLVARVFDDGVFRAEVADVVARLAKASPTALRALKAHYVAAESESLADYLDRETRAHMEIVRSDDTREAFRAFLEKREPVFSRPT
ncbi:MAG: enoyl-CoA hydratase-related protein [Thermoanaerobaculia bacterium]|nr:enoyl-CoA hydratase-related protein [Thermoanaerobaculia bacterium]